MLNLSHQMSNSRPCFRNKIKKRFASIRFSYYFHIDIKFILSSIVFIYHFFLIVSNPRHISALFQQRQTIAFTFSNSRVQFGHIREQNTTRWSIHKRAFSEKDDVNSVQLTASVGRNWRQKSQTFYAYTTHIDTR